MNKHARIHDLKGTGLYQGGAAFRTGEAAQVMHLVSRETLPILEAMVEDGELQKVGEYWKKPAADGHFRFREHPVFPFEAELRQCLVL